jgi:DMSO reductase anchor subunit
MSGVPLLRQTESWLGRWATGGTLFLLLLGLLWLTLATP